jgi:hypothetical protein
MELVPDVVIRVPALWARHPNLLAKASIQVVLLRWSLDEMMILLDLPSDGSVTVLAWCSRGRNNRFV